MVYPNPSFSPLFFRPSDINPLLRTSSEHDLAIDINDWYHSRGGSRNLEREVLLTQKMDTPTFI